MSAMGQNRTSAVGALIRDSRWKWSAPVMVHIGNMRVRALKRARLARSPLLSCSCVMGKLNFYTSGNAGSPSDGYTVQALRSTRFAEAVAHGRNPLPISSNDLCARLGAASAPVLASADFWHSQCRSRRSIAVLRFKVGLIAPPFDCLCIGSVLYPAGV